MNSEMIVMFLLRGVFGYLMQLFAIIIGMHGIGKHRINWIKVSVICVLCAVITAALRSIPMIQFGVHTLLTCLITNVGCVFVCKMDVRKSVFGSIVMMILVLLSDIVNFAVLMPFMNMDTNAMQVFLQSETNKAVSALPGNIVLLLVALLLYLLRVVRQKKAEEA